MASDAAELLGECADRGGHINSGKPWKTSRNETFADEKSLVSSSSHAETGVHDTLGLVAYEPGSRWDQTVKAAQAAGQDVYLEEDGSALNLVIPTSAFNGTVRTMGLVRNASLIAES